MRGACRFRNGSRARSRKRFEDQLSPQGVGVIIEARHLCMVMRGVEKQNSDAMTSAMLGAFRENKQTRDEFLSLVQKQDSSRCRDLGEACRKEEKSLCWFPASVLAF